MSDDLTFWRPEWSYKYLCQEDARLDPVSRKKKKKDEEKKVCFSRYFSSPNWFVTLYRRHPIEAGETPIVRYV